MTTALEPQTITANRMPAITWHRLDINEACVELPALSAGDDACISWSAPAGVDAYDAQGDTGDAQLEHAFDESLAAAQAVDTWETGMGEQASAWLANAVTRRLVFEAPRGVSCDEAVDVRVEAKDGAAVVASVDIIARAYSALRVTIHTDSVTEGQGVAASSVRIFAEEGARVEIDQIQTLASSWIHLDDMGIYEADNAIVKSTQTVLGAAQSYTGFAADLAGYQASCDVDTRYLGHGSARIDFNYVMRQRGAKTTVKLLANGVLTDASHKTLRGTIDLIHGCKGAFGHENETVLLTNEQVRNKTIPIILCDEDDVSGIHGATIGHVNPEQLEYMQARGLTVEQVEDLFAVASFDYAAAHAPTPSVRAGVDRLGAAVLGDYYMQSTEGNDE